MERRSKSLEKNSYKGQEFYSRKIYLEKGFSVNDVEFIEVMQNSNIFNYLYNSAKNTDIRCVICKQKYNKENTAKLNCDCIFCQSCLEEIVRSLTDERMILNSYEKKKQDKCICKCEKPFDYDGALKNLKCLTQKDEEGASWRLMYYINTMCMNCECQVRTKERNEDGGNEEKEEKEEESLDEENFVVVQKHKIVSVSKDKKTKGRKGIDYLDIDHCLCEKCYKLFFKDNKAYKDNNNNIKDKKNKGKNINEKNNGEDTLSNCEDNINNSHNQGSTNSINKKGKNNEGSSGNVFCNIFCQICDQEHLIEEKRRQKNTACCAGGDCNIF